MKVIFLDVDGVLNDFFTEERTKSGWIFISEKYILRLKQIIEATGAKVVLSSDWRYGMDDENPDEDFIELRDKLLEYDIHIMDKTPVINNGRHRGTEIKKWLDDHEGEVENYVIIDDRYDMSPCYDHLVRTGDGMEDIDVTDAIAILEGQDESNS